MANPVEAYLAKLSGPRRTALEVLRRSIREVVPQAEECLSYGIPAYRLEGRVVAGFCARRDGCSYFPFSGRTLATLAPALAGYQRTKSSLHFGPERTLPAALVRRLIRTRLAEPTGRTRAPGATRGGVARRTGVARPLSGRRSGPSRT